MKYIPFTLNLKRAALKVRLSKQDYAKVCDYFKCVGQLRILSGEAFCQGNGWYEIHLNDSTFEVQTAAERFMLCLNTAMFRAEEFAAQKKHRESISQDLKFLTPSRRFVPVLQVQDHRGRLISVASSRAISAARNYNTAISQYVNELFPVSSASPSSLNSLVAKFAH